MDLKNPTVSMETNLALLLIPVLCRTMVTYSKIKSGEYKTRKQNCSVGEKIKPVEKHNRRKKTHT